MKKITVTIAIFAAVLLLGVGVFYYFNQNKEAVTNEKIQANTDQSTVEQSSKKDVREVVWEQMSAQQKTTIDGTWTDGKVSKVTLEGFMMIGVEDASYEGKEVYMIEFPRKQVDTLGDTLMVYADVDTYKLVGYGALD